MVQDLAPEQRALVELLLGGQSYDELADLLDMPSSQVRAQARMALEELAPRAARRVDPDWRGPIADHVLAQQAEPAASATRRHLERSPAAREWAAQLGNALGRAVVEGAAPQGAGDAESSQTDVPPDPGDRASHRGMAVAFWTYVLLLVAGITFFTIIGLTHN